MILDDIRARYPNLGISIYAIVPGEPATLEVIDPAGDVFSFTAPTVAECVAKAFPELVRPTCSMTGLPCVPGCDQKNCAGMHIPINEWPEPAEPEPEASAANVFD